MARHDISLREQKTKALGRAIQEGGGPSEVAKFITENYERISIQAIVNWRVCPPNRAGQVSAAAQARGGKTTVADLCPEFAKIFASEPLGPAENGRKRATA